MSAVSIPIPITLASNRTIACGPVSGARSSRSARVFSIELICSRTNASRAMSRRNSSIMFAGRPVPSGDAEAICEAVGRPTMRFVPVKTAEQQATALLHRGREQLVRQRTMLVNALRAHLAEFGMVAAQGLRNVGELIAIVRDDGDTRLPDVARQVLQVLAAQLEQIEAAIAALERQLLAWHKTNPVSQRLASIPGIG